MAWSALIVTQLGAVAAMLALAAWLLFLNFESRLNRVLALVLFLRACAALLNRLPDLDPAREPLWLSLREYFLLGLSPAMAYLVIALALPRRTQLSRVLAAGIVVGAFAVELAYLYDHCNARCSAGGGFIELGPLTLLTDGLPLAYSLLGTLLAFLATREEGARSIALALAALAFLLQGALEGAIAVAVLARFGIDAPRAAFTTSTWALLVFPLRVLALAPLVVGIGLLTRVAKRHGDAQKRLLVVVGVALASGAAIGFSPTQGVAQSLAIGLAGLWLLVLPLLLAYAILKYRLLGLDARVRRGVRGAVVGGAFVSTFFIATELAQGWLSARYGLTFGIVTSGLLVFALAPIQHLGERAARAALPETSASMSLSPQARAELYRDQARLVWSDGTINRKERVFLDRLREQLGLTLEEAARLEG